MFIKARIREQMTGCAALLVLVGDEAHNSWWIQYEAGLANELRIPKFGIRHPSRRGGFPNAHKGMREIDWSPEELAKVVRELP
ncbi:MAG TPA: TIR domain-containing protein [Longimicrobium sp.]|nr:TIR domain-containing protein [Longimicrobium sp.]